MEKELKTLLLQNNSIIIPGFGSLIRSLSTGSVSFNEFLKFNDHILEKHLISQKGLSKEEAEKEIEQFIAKVHNIVDSGSKFELSGIGHFYKTDKEGIAFEGKVEGANTPPPIKTKSTPAQKEEKKELNETISSQENPKKDLNEKIKEETEKKKKPTPKQEQKTSKNSGDSSAKRVTQNPETMSSSSNNDDKGPDYVHLTQDEIEARHKKRALKGTIIFGILAIVIIAFFQYINPHHEHSEEGHGEGKTEHHEHATPAHEMEDGEATEAKDESQSENTEAKEEANASSPASGGSVSGDPTNPAMESSIPVSAINASHYVISASFASAKKAKHQARLLMIMDYPALVIKPEEGKFYACIGAYTSYNQAQKALAEYKTKKPDAWLFTP